MGNIASNGTMVFHSLKHGDKKVGMGDIFSGILFSDNFEFFYQFFLLIKFHKKGLYECHVFIHMNLFLVELGTTVWG